MSRSHKFLKKWSARRASTRRRPARFVSGFESLEPRLMLSVSAFFTPQAGGLLTVIGDGLDNTVEVSRDDAGNLLVNGGEVSIQGGTATVDNTSVVQGFGLGRHGNIKPNESHGALSSSDPSRGKGPRFESKEPQLSQSVTAFYTPQSGVLTVIGNNLDNNIEVSRDAAGKILVNGGAVTVQGGTPTVANTSLIQGFGQAGNDTITMNETNGALPSANLFGGSGNDTLTGGSGADQLFGQSGNDTLLGKGGNDFLFGGADNDVLTGGDGDDQVFGESGNDRMIWNPGDDTDLNEGGDGSDTVEVNGGNGAETFTTTANGTRVRFDRLDPAPFSIDIGTSENLVLNANGGDDSFSATGNLAALIKIAV